MRTVVLGVLVVGVLAGSLAQAAAATPPASVVAAGEQDAGSAEEGGDLCHPDLFDQYFPLMPRDDLHEAVEDIKLMTIVLNILPFGALWAPLVLLPDDKPDINADILLSAVVPWVAGWGIAVGFSMVGTVLAIPTGGLCGIVGCLGLVGLFPACWMAPVAVLHAWDRAYRCSEVSTGLDKFKSKKKSGADDGGATPKKKAKKKAPKPEADDGATAY